MSKTIPYGKQNILDEDIQAVVDVLKSDLLTQGPKIEEFETAFAKYIGSKYAVAVSNGTAALHLAAIALGVNENSHVITTPITFAASSNCIQYCRGHISFCDIDPLTYTIDIAKLEALILSKPKGHFAGIIPVDFAGIAVNLEEIRKIADAHGLWIIEDACHAPGGYFIDSKGVQQFCGNGNFADLSIFSFHPVKHLTTGEGGAITTNSFELYQKLKALRTHGIVRDPKLFTNPLPLATATDTATAYYPWYHEMQMLGYNYRLTDFQAALGISQLKRAAQGLERRRQIAKRYAEAFRNNEVIVSQSGEVEGHAYHLYVINIKNRADVYTRLCVNGVFPQIHYFPTHLMPYYRQFGWKPGDMPVAEEYYTRCLSLPMFPTLTDAEQDKVINLVLSR